AGRRARRRADGQDDRAERGADAAAPARARRRAGGRRMRTAAPLPRPLVLPRALRGCGDRDLRPRGEDAADAVHARVGARRADGRLTAAARGRVGGRGPQMSDTVVFIPAWNEEENLPAVLDELHAELPDVDVLVVDDGSTDRTADVAREHGAEVLSLGMNRGLPIGIAAGYAWANEHDYALCGRVDADGQHPAHELKKMLGRGRGAH